MFANRYTAVLDACVLAPPANRDLILCLAEAKFFRPQWSGRILGEAEKAIADIIRKRRPETADAAAIARRVVEQVSEAFPEATIDAAYEVYEQSLDLPDPNDRHVLAAAIHCRASTIVTDNLKDFPARELAKHGIEAKSADDFIADEIDLDIIKAVGVVRNMRIRLKRPTISASDLLLKMEARGLIETTRLLRPYEDLI